MRDDGQPSTRVRVDQFGHGREGALLEFSQVLAPSGPDVEIPSFEAPQDIAGRALDLVARQALPVAEVEFAQPRIQLRPKAARLPENRGGLHCAAEIARNEYVDGFAGEFSSERIRLRLAAIGERRVPVPLPATRRVPARLGVSDQQQRGLVHGPKSASDQRRTSPASGSANRSPATIGVKQWPSSR